MIFFKGYILFFAPLLIPFALIYFPLRLAHPEQQKWANLAGMAIVATANASFMVLNVLLIPGLLGGKEGWFQLWVFIFLPASLICGIMTSRLITKEQRGF